MLLPTLSQISIYPIKSITGNALTQSMVEPFGLRYDRRFVLSDQHGQFITARSEPKLALIHSVIDEQGLRLHAPGMPEIRLSYAQFSAHYQGVTVWQDNVSAQHCHRDYDAWFSEFLGQPCQLLFFGEQSQRHAYGTDAPVSFADGYPLLLISQGSLDALNARLPVPMRMSRFRPNLVVDHTLPFAEDGWQQIRIGDVEFEVHSGCARCVMTTLSPGSAEPHPLREPLATLQQFRRQENGDVMFGQNLIALNQGHIRLGDKVEVLSTNTAPYYPDNTQPREPALLQAPEETGFTLLCTSVIEETQDVKTFEFTRYDGMPVHYTAGQHIAITVYVNGEPIRRRYTLSSSPTQPEKVSITVKRVENGLVSNYLHDVFTAGHILHVRNISGHFTLQAATDVSRVLLISAGSGITPVLSMLKTMVADSLNNDIVYLHSARTQSDIVAKQAVEHLAKQHGRCQVIYTLTRDNQPPKPMLQGHISQETLASIPDLLQRQVFLCGPNGFKQHCEELLIEMGLPPEQFHFESFGGADATNLVNNEEEKAITIRFANSDTVINANNKASILTQCERAGEALPSDCRAGICGECKVKLVSGEVTQLPDMGGLSAVEKAANYILTCSCIPQSDLCLAKDE